MANISSNTKIKLYHVLMLEAEQGVQENGEEVAVKLLRETSEKAYEEFQKELDNLRILNHDNIVRLVGYCYETHRELAEYNGRRVLADKTYRALCFEYLCNGSLGKYLSGMIVSMPFKHVNNNCRLHFCFISTLFYFQRN